MPDSYMDARTQGIGELIEQRQLFRVPDHQRDYAWAHDDEVATFLDDVERAVRDGAPEYFLGLIVLVKPRAGGTWEVLDGQQRLATTTMIYAGIREWLHAAGLSSEGIKVQDRFIGMSALGEREDRARITLNVNDRKAFHDLVVNRCNDDTLRLRRDAAGRNSSVRRLIEAALTCRQEVAKFAADTGAEPSRQAQALYDLANYLRDKTTVVVMNVASSANAYVIFESLNDRGLDLSVLDLVKNHLFGRANGHLAEVQANWMRMAANLGDRPADDFLKVFWTSKYGRIQRGRLFEEWRLKYGRPEVDVVTLSDELATAADLFSALDAPDHEIWAVHSNQTKRLVKALGLLGNQQVRPVMLAAIRSYTPERMERLLEHLATLTVRYQTVGKGRTGLLEIACAKLARGIADGTLKSPERVWSEVAHLVPADGDFKQAFCRYTETNSSRARYVLTELERTAYRVANGTDREVAPTEDLSLEHILPRNPGSEWATEMQADRELREWAPRIGNMCLLGEGTNRQLGSRGFAAKRDRLKASADLVLTAEVATFEQWDRTSIAARQERLADLAVQTWPVLPRT